MLNSVTIIVPTLCEAGRSKSLARAIASIRSASTLSVTVMVCVNGQRWDNSVVASLRQSKDVQVEQTTEASLPKAIAHARRLVKTTYFGFLDDDDELLPGSIDARLATLNESPSSDVVVTNGFRNSGDNCQLIMRNLSKVPSEPLRSLFIENWLASCGALFRTAAIPEYYFDDYHAYAEWTWLAYRLALDRKAIVVLDRPTFVVHDTADSLSKSSEYKRSYLSLYHRMLELNPPEGIRTTILKRISAAWHDMSTDYLSRGERIPAIQCHLRSLIGRGGVKYLPYTRHLL